MERANKGFAVIELIMLIAVVAMVVLVAAAPRNNDFSYGVNGITETRCIAGYKHVVGEQGQARQVLDENGRGIKCQ